MRRASAFSPRPFQEPRPPAGHLQLASRALVPKDAQAPKPPSFPQCPSEADRRHPGFKEAKRETVVAPRAESGLWLCSVWPMQTSRK